MRVAVGSENPVKRAATERALADVATAVESVAVESGVAEQPWGEAETIEGAKTRAERARSADDYDLGVGIEGGVASVDGAEGLFLIMWAAVTDGEQVGLGAGPRLELPETVASRLEAGAELGPVLDDLLDTTGIKQTQGAAGVLTDRIITREDALFQAVAGGFGPFVSGHYD
ncbi:MAG: inosine/xanthosine triphosphatase [Halobacteriota archaeon]